jgi:hypothetical protein
MRTRARRVRIPLPINTIDETGNRYGRLVVLEYAGREEPLEAGQGGPARWLCQCDCGNQIAVRGKRLRVGRQVSCGCERADPNIRQAARMKVSARRRKAIAVMGGAAGIGVPKPRSS